MGGEPAADRLTEYLKPGTVTLYARGDWVEKSANLMVKAGHVKVEKAREISASLPAEEMAAATGTG